SQVGDATGPVFKATGHPPPSTSSNIAKRPETRYSPAKIRRCVKTPMLDDPAPDFMTTESLRRFELTLRTQNKRYARLTNAHSKDVQFYRWTLAMQVGSTTAASQQWGEWNIRSGVRSNRVPLH